MKTFLTAAGAPARWLSRGVARVALPVQMKLLAAFLTLAALLIALGVVGLQTLGAANDRAEELGRLEAKVSAYRQLQTGIARALYYGGTGFSSATDDELRRNLDELRGLSGTFESLEALVEGDEAEVAELRNFRTDYNRVLGASIQVLESLLAGSFDAADELDNIARNQGDSVQRLSDDHVAEAEAEMAATIADNHDDYIASRWIVIGLAGGSILLALILGYAIASSVTRPVQQMEQHMQAVSAGDFSRQVSVDNRDELGALAANLNAMNDELGRLYRELEDASRHKSEFLASMSHELRTPLNAIIGFSEVLKERMFGDLNEKQEEYVDDVLTSGKHLLSLINDILDLSKVEAGRMDLDVIDFALPSVLEHGMSMVRERAARHGLTLGLDVAPDVGVVEADERKVKQVVFNLLSNAVKFTPSGGHVEVSSRLREDDVLVSVSDTGPGIRPEEQERIFEEFRQAGSTNAAHQEGTGLGLALSKRFVELHGGRIWVDSVPGEGATFSFTLPVRRSPAVSLSADGVTAEAGTIPAVREAQWPVS
jgi:signal transduction histidine kinase